MESDIFLNSLVLFSVFSKIVFNSNNCFSRICILFFTLSSSFLLEIVRSLLTNQENETINQAELLQSITSFFAENYKDEGFIFTQTNQTMDGEDYLRSDEDICHVDSRNEWHLIDNCVSDYNGDMIHEDDAVELCGNVYSNEHAHEDDATRCIIDGEYYLNEDMIKVDGGMMYEGNQEHYKLILENLKTINNATKIA
jgi:hypothetical protein